MSDGAIEGVRAAARSRTTLAYICVSHFFSHFYGFYLAPLLPVLNGDLGIGYGLLGLVTGTLSLATVTAIVPVGGLVDRLGPHRVLSVGLAIEAAGLLSLSMAEGAPALFLSAALIGLGNSVFHPAHYTILSTTMPKQRLGRSFSIHTFAGFLGWAVAPLALTAGMALSDWRSATACFALLGLAYAAGLALTFWSAERRRGGHGSAASAASRTPSLSLLKSPAVLGCVLFCLLISMAGMGLNTFLASLLIEAEGFSQAAASLSLSLLIGCAAVSILAGGVLADRIQRHGRLAASAYGVSALLLFLLWLMPGLPHPAIVVLVALVGLTNGLVPPSRDLILRRAIPPDMTGRGFAVTTAAMDLGSVVTPAIYGFAMAAASGRIVFLLTALLLLCAVLVVLAMDRREPAAAV